MLYSSLSSDVILDGHSKSSELLVKSLLNELFCGSITLLNGLNRIEKLAISPKIFNRAFDLLFDESKSVEYDTEFQVLSEEAIRKMCYLMGNLYIVSVTSDDYKFLRKISNRCDEILFDWLDPVVYRNNMAKIKTDGTMAQNLQCVFNLLEICCREFKIYDPALLEKVALRASMYAFNNSYKGQCKQISLMILNLLITMCRPSA